uniref:Apoptosis regulator Bcl-2 homolog n=1 Tax=Rhabditophanes sp. KR3021 TaxID=114890 RepID=A0AC35UE30_9BILA
IIFSNLITNHIYKNKTLIICTVYFKISFVQIKFPHTLTNNSVGPSNECDCKKKRVIRHNKKLWHILLPIFTMKSVSKDNYSEEFITYLLQNYIIAKTNQPNLFDSTIKITKKEALKAESILDALILSCSDFECQNREYIVQLINKFFRNGPHISFNLFMEIITSLSGAPNLNENLFSYGRFVGIMTFIGSFSEALIEADLLADLETIVLYSSKMLSQSINRYWKKNHLNWNGFCEKTKASLVTEETQKATENVKLVFLALSCFVAVGAVGFLFTHKIKF